MLPETWVYNEVTYSSNGVFFAILLGLGAGLGIGKITEYYTGTGKLGEVDCASIGDRIGNDDHRGRGCWHDVHCNSDSDHGCRDHRCLQLPVCMALRLPR